MENKETVRKFYGKIRRNISKKYRLDASERLLSYFSAKSSEHILSYASFGDEFETHELNKILAKKKRLVLPKIVGKSLHCFFVFNYETDLVLNKWGIVEPNQKICPEVDPNKIDLILVPGLSFDKKFNRIGYGGGYYDRFLPKIPKKTVTMGLGFKKQLSPKLLPRQTNDFPLDQLLLF